MEGWHLSFILISWPSPLPVASKLLCRNQTSSLWYMNKYIKPHITMGSCHHGCYMLVQSPGVRQVWYMYMLVRSCRVWDRFGICICLCSHVGCETGSLSRQGWVDLAKATVISLCMVQWLLCWSHYFFYRWFVWKLFWFKQIRNYSDLTVAMKCEHSWHYS